jgi:hypothetical protein
MKKKKPAKKIARKAKPNVAKKPAKKLPAKKSKPIKLPGKKRDLFAADDPGGSTPPGGGGGLV